MKPHKPGDPQSPPQFFAGGRFTARGLPVFIIVATAYNLPFQSTQLSGGPEWIRSMDALYDIEAKTQEGEVAGLSSKAREDKMRLMLQTLLADRFKMTVRRETKDQPVYALVVAKNGPKLQKAKIEDKDCSADPVNMIASCHLLVGGQGGGIHGKAATMADVTVFVGNWTDRPMVDQTGLDGLYEIDTEGWAPMRPRPIPPPGTPPSAEDAAMADPARPTLYMIFDKLGLKMESQRAPVDMFVIEHAEKASEN